MYSNLLLSSILLVNVMITICQADSFNASQVLHYKQKFQDLASKFIQKNFIISYDEEKISEESQQIPITAHSVIYKRDEEFAGNATYILNGTENVSRIVISNGFVYQFSSNSTAKTECSKKAAGKISDVIRLFEQQVLSSHLEPSTSGVNNEIKLVQFKLEETKMVSFKEMEDGNLEIFKVTEKNATFESTSQNFVTKFDVLIPENVFILQEDCANATVKE